MITTNPVAWGVAGFFCWANPSAITRISGRGVAEAKVRVNTAHARFLLTLLGLGMLFIWACFWAVCMREGRLVDGRLTWVPRYKKLGCDFDVNYYAARAWLEKTNPYEGYDKEGEICEYDYPPLLLPLFAWCSLVPRQVGLFAWLLLTASGVVLGAVACWRTRRELGLWELPLPLVVAAALLSYPVLFEMERGNCNVPVLALLIAAVASLRERSLARDLIAGLLLATAAWIKIYPGVLVFGLFALRRWRATVVCVTAGLLIGLADVSGTLQFFEKQYAHSAAAMPSRQGRFFYDSHTLSGSWELLWRNTPAEGLARVPGMVGGACVLLPVVIAVSYRLWRAPDHPELIYPYFLWLTGAATFFSITAEDYNLFFLILAALALWDCRDPLALQVLMALALYWWQPFRLWLRGGLPFPPQLFFALKLVSLFTVAILLARMAAKRARVTQRMEIEVGHANEAMRQSSV
jgi:hypothetical protein